MLWERCCSVIWQTVRFSTEFFRQAIFGAFSEFFRQYILRQKFFDTKIFLTRKIFDNLVEKNPNVWKIHSLNFFEGTFSTIFQRWGNIFDWVQRKFFDSRKISQALMVYLDFFRMSEFFPAFINGLYIFFRHSNFIHNLG